jgi:hypothetical protein
MATPSPKSLEAEVALEELCLRLWKRTRRESIENDICLVCGKPARFFRDVLAQKEYTISGMCQKCQDETFGE